MKIIIASLLLALTLPVLAVAPVNMDDLLNQVEQGRHKDAQANAKRIQAFKKDKASQAKKLKDMKSERSRQEGISKRKESQFDVNEQEIIQLQDTLKTRLGSLKELFGVLQQAAGQASGDFQASVTNVQFPERIKFLDDLAKKMGQSDQLASIEEIERLWFELQREMTQSAKVVKFKTTIISADGKEVERDVTRIGVFNTVSNGRYLNYTPETGRIAELARQPQSRFLNKIGELESSTSGYHAFGLDPSRGQLLSMLVKAPSLEERLDQGGIIGYIVLSLGALALIFAIWRLFYLFVVGGKIRSQMKNLDNPGNNPLGHVLKVYSENKAANVETLELRLGEAVMREVPKFQSGLMFMKIIAVIAPLMGLLGTVTGMIITFQMITLFGAGDPQMMAGGISQALMTTVEGLVVAIPTVFLHTLMSSRAKVLSQILEEQAVGMVAEQSEAHLGQS
ncbi:MAG: MotA/TolQ/ExbB proton channel family protein [bacterium]